VIPFAQARLTLARSLLFPPLDISFLPLIFFYPSHERQIEMSFLSRLFPRATPLPASVQVFRLDGCMAERRTLLYTAQVCGPTTMPCHRLGQSTPLPALRLRVTESFDPTYPVGSLTTELRDRLQRLENGALALLV
jgi:hypothetical protein